MKPRSTGKRNCRRQDRRPWGAAKPGRKAGTNCLNKRVSRLAPRRTILGEVAPLAQKITEPPPENNYPTQLAMRTRQGGGIQVKSVGGPKPPRQSPNRAVPVGTARGSPRRLSGIGRLIISRRRRAAELGQDLEQSVQVGHPRSEPIDEFVQHEFAIHQAVEVFVDLARDRVQKLHLNPAERFGRRAAGPRQVGIGLLPLTQFGNAAGAAPKPTA